MRHPTWMYRTAAAALVLTGAGCHPLGPRQLPLDRFDYNTAVATSANEQMLLNLVRLRYGEVPTFLAVNSVLTQYVWTGELGVSGGAGENLNFPAWTVGGSANVRYIERPTVTYSPLSGQEFAAQLLNPVRADVVFSLVSSGWPPDQLLGMTIQRINDVHNVGFANPSVPAQEQNGRFNRVIALIIELAKHDSIELVRSRGTEQEEPYLEFDPTPDTEAAELTRELKDILGLDQAQNRFRVTRKIVGRAPDEITIRMHSLLELMGLLSSGVLVPEKPAEAESESVAPASDRTPGPLTVLAVSERPTDAFVAVRYNGTWYSIPRSDAVSIRAFGLLTYLFQMQASQNQGSGPLLTVPVG